MPTIAAKKAFVRQEEQVTSLTIPPPPPEQETGEVRVPIIPHDKYVQTEDMKLWEVFSVDDSVRFLVIADTSERAIALVVDERYGGVLAALDACEVDISFENEGILMEEY